MPLWRLASGAGRIVVLPKLQDNKRAIVLVPREPALGGTLPNVISERRSHPAGFSWSW
jgi:hypothetical protein